MVVAVAVIVIAAVTAIVVLVVSWSLAIQIEHRRLRHQQMPVAGREFVAMAARAMTVGDDGHRLKRTTQPC